MRFARSAKRAYKPAGLARLKIFVPSTGTSCRFPSLAVSISEPCRAHERMGGRGGAAAPLLPRQNAAGRAGRFEKKKKEAAASLQAAKCDLTDRFPSKTAFCFTVNLFPLTPP